MDQQTKICKYCNRENFIDNSKCLHCGRYFYSDNMGKSKDINKVGKIPSSINIEKFKLIPPIALLISLFLPWLSIFIMRITAFDIATFFSMTASVPGGGNLAMTVTRIMIYMIPVGCIIFIFRSLTDRSLRIVGTITGLFPILIFFFLLSQSPEIIKMLSLGFIIALISGISLIILSSKE